MRYIQKSISKFQLGIPVFMYMLPVLVTQSPYKTQMCSGISFTMPCSIIKEELSYTETDPIRYRCLYKVAHMGGFNPDNSGLIIITFITLLAIIG